MSTFKFADGAIHTDRVLSDADRGRIHEKYIEFGYDHRLVQEWIDRGMPREMPLTFDEQLRRMLRDHYKEISSVTRGCKDQTIVPMWSMIIIGNMYAIAENIVAMWVYFLLAAAIFVWRFARRV